MFTYVLKINPYNVNSLHVCTGFENDISKFATKPLRYKFVME